MWWKEVRIDWESIKETRPKREDNGRVLSFPVHLGQHTSGLGIPCACTCVGLGTHKRRRKALVKQLVCNTHSKRNHAKEARHCCFCLSMPPLLDLLRESDGLVSYRTNERGLSICFR